MHYYQHHIGDFVRDTARLNDSQCMAYLRLIWLYYESEKPLPNNAKVLALKIGADQELVSDLLEAFFTRDGDAWRHSRCDNEIESFKRMSDGGRKGAEKRWRKGVDSHPIATPSPAQCEANANQEPITNNHKPVTNKKHKAPTGELFADVDPQVASDFLAMRKRQNAPVTKTAIDGIEREAMKAGLSLEAALRVCCERSWRGFKAEWILPQKTAQPYQTAADKRIAFAEALTGQNRERATPDFIDIN